MSEERIMHIIGTAATSLMLGGIASLVTGNIDILVTSFVGGVAMSFFWPLRKAPK